MKILGECWHCKEDARYESRHGFLHCSDCSLRVIGIMGVADDERVVCGCQGPPRSCHKCLEHIRWGGWTTDEDGDAKKVGSCDCEGMSWVQVDFKEPPETSVSFHRDVE